VGLQAATAIGLRVWPARRCRADCRDRAYFVTDFRRPRAICGGVQIRAFAPSSRSLSRRGPLHIAPSERVRAAHVLAAGRRLSWFTGIQKNVTLISCTCSCFVRSGALCVLRVPPPPSPVEAVGFALLRSRARRRPKGVLVVRPRPTATDHRDLESKESGLPIDRSSRSLAVPNRSVSADSVQPLLWSRLRLSRAAVFCRMGVRRRPFAVSTERSERPFWSAESRASPRMSRFTSCAAPWLFRAPLLYTIRHPWRLQRVRAASDSRYSGFLVLLALGNAVPASRNDARSARLLRREIVRSTTWVCRCAGMAGAYGVRDRQSLGGRDRPRFRRRGVH